MEITKRRILEAAQKWLETTVFTEREKGLFLSGVKMGLDPQMQMAPAWFEAIGMPLDPGENIEVIG